MEVAGILKDKRGSFSLMAVSITLAALLLGTVLFEFFRLQIIASGVRDAVEAAVITVAADNYDKTFDGVRQGYSGGYIYTSSWVPNVYPGDVYAQLSKTLGTSGVTHGRVTGGRMEFSLSDLTVDITNAPLAPGRTEQCFLVEGYITLTVPLSFGWEALPPMVLRLKLTSGFSAKF